MLSVYQLYEKYALNENIKRAEIILPQTNGCHNGVSLVITNMPFCVERFDELTHCQHIGHNVLSFNQSIYYEVIQNCTAFDACFFRCR